MLKLAAKHYLHTLGDKCYIANPDNAEWSNVGCLDIAIKRRPKWFWQKDIYTIDHFGLDDLLDSPLPVDKSSLLQKPEPLTPNYNLNSKHTVKSKIGGTIASLVSLDLGADDTFTVAVDFEDMMKQSINYVAVAEMLSTKKINLSKNYIKHIAKNKYNVICLVTQYIYLSKKTELKITSNWAVDESSSGKEPQVAKLNASINDQGSIQNDNTKLITFDAGTKLAFDFAELLIGPDGSIEMLDRSEDVKGGILIEDSNKNVTNYCAHISIDKQNYDTPDGTDGVSHLTQSLDKLFIDNTSLDATKSLIALAIEDKKILKQFETFLLQCQHNRANNEQTVDLTLFDSNQIKNSHLSKIFQRFGLDLQAAGPSVAIDKLNVELIEGLLMKIHAIYHLEVEYFTSLHKIVNKYDLNEIKALFKYLKDVKVQRGSTDKTAYNNLIKNTDMKNLLLSVGVTENDQDGNEYFEPTLILLHCS